MRFLVIALLLMPSAAGAQITDLERQRLLAHMEMTKSWLESELIDLSAAQAAFRPAAERWSILDVLDHLVVVGPIYWRDLQEAKATPGRAGTMSDVDVLWYGIDRTNRETALAREEPSRQIKDLASGLKAYRAQHARLREYVRTTKDDLRRRLVARQSSDAYQWALLISTHEQRHILQIREIKENPAFPKR